MVWLAPTLVTIGCGALGGLVAWLAVQTVRSGARLSATETWQAGKEDDCARRLAVLGQLTDTLSDLRIDVAALTRDVKHVADLVGGKGHE